MNIRNLSNRFASLMLAGGTLGDLLGHDRADAVDLDDLLRVGLVEGVDRTEVVGQRLGGDEADAGQPERVEPGAVHHAADVPQRQTESFTREAGSTSHAATPPPAARQEPIRRPPTSRNGHQASHHQR